jgi:inosine triphosphate pyrophosphatase
MALFFITSSPHKFAEVKALLPTIEQMDMDLPEIQELDAHKIISAKLFEARMTLRHGSALMVEDTSLYIDGMNGLPGPLNKWFLKSIGPEGIYKLAKIFGSAARAKTIIGYTDEKGAIQFFEGETHGQIVEPKAKTEFGWDAIFLPEGASKTYAEMSSKEKSNISHRGKALQAMKEALKI